MRDAGRWKPHILSGAPSCVVSAEWPGVTRGAPVVTLALQSALLALRVDVADAFHKRNRNCMPRSAPSRAHGASSKSGKPHAIRIIGGDWKRTPLPVLDLDGLRPTPDRVRETLFNWLGQRLDGRALSRSVRGQRRARFRGSVARRRAGADGRAQRASGRASCGRIRNASPRARSKLPRPTACGLLRACRPLRSTWCFSTRLSATICWTKRWRWPRRSSSSDGFLYVEAGAALGRRRKRSAGRVENRAGRESRRCPLPFAAARKMRNNAPSITSAGRFHVTRAAGAKCVAWTL